MTINQQQWRRRRWWWRWSSHYDDKCDTLKKLKLYIGWRQCDQMTRLCFQYLAIYTNENVPKSIQSVTKWVKNFAQNQINLKYIAKHVNLPKWWNFAKSGHTGEDGEEQCFKGEGAEMGNFAGQSIAQISYFDHCLVEGYSPDTMTTVANPINPLRS